MLATLRKQVSSWAAKIILGVLVISFVFFWGIGDVFRRGGGFEVAHVGRHALTRSDLAQELKVAVKRLETQTKQPITPQMIMETGLLHMVLNEMISGTLLDLEATRLGIVVPDHILGQSIQNMEIFQDESGKFNRKRLQQVLADMNLTENKFVQLMRRDMIRQSFLENVFTKQLNQAELAPVALAEAFYQWAFGRRKINYVHINEADIEVPDTLSDSELENFYNREGTVFSEPEKRDVTVAWADPASKSQMIIIEPAQIKQYYNENQATFTQPEQRQAVQAVFTTRDAAQAFADTISKNPGNFKKQVVKSGGKVSTITTTHEALPTVLANAVFTTPANKISAVVEHEDAFYVFRVAKIETGGVQPMSKVESVIKKRLQTELAAQKMAEQVRAIEDDLAGGATLTEVTKKYGLAMAKVTGLVAKRENKSLASLPESIRTEVLNQAMTLNAGDISPLWQTPTGEYVVVQVDKVIPKHQPALSDIRDKVVQWWQYKQRKAKVEQLTNELIQKSNEGQSFAEIVKAKGLTIRHEWIDNSKKESRLPESVLKVVYDMKVNQVRPAYLTDGVMVVQLEKMEPVTATAGKMKEWREGLSQALAMDILTLYINALRKDFKVTVYPEAVQSLLARE